MKRILKRTLAMLLCLIMVFPMCTTAFAADSRTEQYAKKAAAAGIKKVTEAIPVVGGTVSEIIDTFLPDMLGIEGDQTEVLAKLNEIKYAIKNVGQQIADNQHALFTQFYGEQIKTFNDTLTREKSKFVLLSTRVKEIEDDYGVEQRDEKQAELATLISNSDVLNLASDLATLTDYICGTQISHRQEEGILTLAYKLNCNDSVLGCEAALKNTNYVDTICGYIESAYATLFSIAMAKLYICESLDDPNNNSFKESDFPGYTPKEKKNIISAVFGNNDASLRANYNRIFDETDPRSVINTYNNMIQDAWFSYIDSTDYQSSPARITYIPLNPEMGFLAPMDARFTKSLAEDSSYSSVADKLSTLTSISGTDRFGALKKNYGYIDAEMLETAHSALSVEQIDRLIKHMAHNPVFGTDMEELSFICVLDELGFSFSEYNTYVESLPKVGIGAIYRDPSLPKEQTDGKYKVMPTGTEYYSDGKNNVAEGWFSDVVKGYGLQESLNSSDIQTSAEMVRVCFDTAHNNDHIGDYVFNNVMLLYFTKSSDTTPIGAFFDKLSHATIPIICIGAAAIIAVPTVILVRRKKKAAK